MGRERGRMLEPHFPSVPIPSMQGTLIYIQLDSRVPIPFWELSCSNQFCSVLGTFLGLGTLLIRSSVLGTLN